jgi:hypothetical protein
MFKLKRAYEMPQAQTEKHASPGKMRDGRLYASDLPYHQFQLLVTLHDIFPRHAQIGFR